MYRLAYGILRESTAAEDACQQAMMRLWERGEQIRDAAAVRGWLARTVLHEALAPHRRRAVEKRAIAELGRRASEPATVLDRMADRELVTSALEHLDEHRRIVVAMRVIHGISGKEAAQTLGCSASEVSRYLHEGLDRMRSHIRATDAPVSQEQPND